MAIELTADVAASAARLVDELRRRCERLAPRARVTWVPPARMHLTLRFIGEADEVRTRAIEAALQPAFDLPPFDVALAGAGVFPDHRPPRVFWAGVVAGGESLGRLYRLLSDRLDRAGVPHDSRLFSAHLTLGRVREGAGLRARSLLDGLGDTELGRVRVSETVLFDSRQSASGPEYVARQRTRLGT